MTRAVANSQSLGRTAPRTAGGRWACPGPASLAPEVSGRVRTSLWSATHWLLHHPGERGGVEVPSASKPMLRYFAQHQ